MPREIKSALYVRPDGFGDLVIFSAALTQLQAAWPECRHTLVVRPGYEALAPLLPPTLHWHVVPINPFTQRPGEVRDALATMFAELEKLSPDLVVAPALNRTWLEVAVAAHFPTARRVALGRHSVDPNFSVALRLELGVEAETTFTEIVPADERKLDWENGYRVVDHLLERPAERNPPMLEVPQEAGLQADAFIAVNGLRAGAYVVLFAGGLANIPIKAWPPERFAELALWCRRERGLSVLLAGFAGESAMIEAILAHLERLGESPPSVWLGQPGEMALLAALLGRACCYVGHDTGAMHIAAAVGQPVVGIFGGGHWPRFRPLGKRVVSVVQPLPCFNCNWDCLFRSAPCVKAISTADVIEALQFALESRAETFDRVLAVRNVSEETIQLIGAVTPLYVGLQHDRIERLHVIERIQHEIEIRNTEIMALQREGEARDRELVERRAACDAKDMQIADLRDAITQIRDNHDMRSWIQVVREKERQIHRLKGMLAKSPSVQRRAVSP